VHIAVGTVSQRLSRRLCQWGNESTDHTGGRRKLKFTHSAREVFGRCLEPVRGAGKMKATNAFVPFNGDLANVNFTISSQVQVEP
jgi:hypothetical protein